MDNSRPSFLSEVVVRLNIKIGEKNRNKPKPRTNPKRRTNPKPKMKVQPPKAQRKAAIAEIKSRQPGVSGARARKQYMRKYKRDARGKAMGSFDWAGDGLRKRDKDYGSAADKRYRAAWAKKHPNKDGDGNGKGKDKPKPKPRPKDPNGYGGPQNKGQGNADTSLAAMNRARDAGHADSGRRDLGSNRGKIRARRRRLRLRV